MRMFSVNIIEPPFFNFAIGQKDQPAIRSSGMVREAEATLVLLIFGHRFIKVAMLAGVTLAALVQLHHSILTRIKPGLTAHTGLGHGEEVRGSGGLVLSILTGQNRGNGMTHIVWVFVIGPLGAIVNVVKKIMGASLRTQMTVAELIST